MEYKNFQELTARVSGAKKNTVAVAAAHDEHALEAVFHAADAGMVDYLLVGDGGRIRDIAGHLGKTVEPDRIIDTADDAAAAAKAVELIRRGEAGFIMKGGLETATLMRAVLNKETGIRTGSTMSHFGLYQVPAYHKLIAVTDGGMIPHPTFEQKQMVLENALNAFRSLGYQMPKAALLCASETVNDKQPETGEAARLKEMADQGRFGACVVEGPISFDLTVSAESAGIKGFQSPIVGDADILVVPNLVSGNVLGKSFVYIGGAKLAGCIIGAQVPIVLTSRGSSAEEKYLSILLCAAQNTGV